MKGISKRAVTILLMITIALSLMPVLPVRALAISDAYGEGGPGDVQVIYGELVTVIGTGVTAGADVMVYWDSVSAWDGESGLLNTTAAEPAGTFNITFDVPEALQGSHYVWIKDGETGDTEVGPTLTMNPSIEIDPDEGLSGDEVDILGYGFGDEEDIDMVWYNDGVSDIVLSTSPATPETDSLGSWTAEFDLPSEPYAVYTISANDTVPNEASTTFEIGVSITLDIEEGPTGTVVEVSGRGFAPGDIDTADVLILPDAVECYVIDGPVDPGSNGEFTMEIIIPSVTDLDDDHEIQVTGFGGNVTTASFDVDGDAEIEVDPEFGVQGTTIAVEGWNFTQIAGEDVILELWDVGYLVDITESGDIETSSAGSFDETFRVPARNNGKYTIHAVQDDYNIETTVSFRIGTVVVILAVDDGVSGEKIVMTGTGFEDTGAAAWNATFDGEFLTEGDVDADGNLEISGMVPTFWVPTKDPGAYEIEVYDIEADIAVSVEFTVTDKTMVETSPIVAPNDYNVTITGTYFTQDDTTGLTFLLWNATDEWDIEVRQAGSLNVKVQNEDDEGEFEAWWKVDDNETLSLGTYTLNVTDDNDLYAMVQFSVVEKTLDIDPRKATFRIGDTVAFNVEVSFPADDSYIEIYDPTDELYWQTNVFSSAVWVKVGDTHIVPFYEQVAGGNPMILLDDAPLGEWSWTWYDVDDEELDSGVFMVSEAPEDVLSAQIEDLNTALTGLEEDIAGVQDEVAAVKTDIASAKAAADAAKAAADAATAAISDVASQAGDAKTSADAAKAAAEDAKSAATGLTTLVYGAIGASLVAALAAIVSLMQISRRIAG
jgi:hypothetical protein